jgi:hypothetical protein
LNLDNNLIELIEEEVDIKDKGIWVNKEEILYNLGEGYIDFDLIKESNNKVIYRR